MLQVHPIMGLYLTLPFTIHVPLLNRPWRRLMSTRDEFWRFLDEQIAVCAFALTRLHFLLLLRITSSAFIRAASSRATRATLLLHTLKRWQKESACKIWAISSLSHFCAFMRTIFGNFSRTQLKMLLLDLFFAGLETTVTSLKVNLLHYSPCLSRWLFSGAFC